MHIITSLHSKFHFIIYRNKKKVLVCLACSIVSAITVCFQDYMLISQDNEEKIGHFFMTKITITPLFINPYKKCWCHFVPFGKLYPMQLELEHSKQILFFCLIPILMIFMCHHVMLLGSSPCRHASTDGSYGPDGPHAWRTNGPAPPRTHGHAPHDGWATTDVTQENVASVSEHCVFTSGRQKD